MSRVDLEYHIPLVGRIRTSLYREARQLYEFLDKKGEIARLKKLDHLGVVRRAYEGAHHPRWEYIVLIMHLIDLIRNNVHEAHLSSSSKIGAHTISSGQELLKMWVLLLHLGHVPWTFTAERALLAEVKRSRTLYRDLLGALPDDQWRAYGRRLVQQEDVYRFYHVIACLRLSRLAEGVPGGSEWMTALKSYCLRERPVERLAGIYERVRQIAFIALDSHYTPAMAGLDVSEMVTEPRRLTVVLDPPDSSSVGLLNAMASHLYESVYLSSDVMRHTVSLIPALRQEIRRNEEKPLPQMVEELASGRIQEYVNQGSADAYHVARVPFRVVEPFRSLILPEARPLSEEDDWCAELAEGLRDHVAVSVWPFPDGRQEVVDVFACECSGRVFEAAWVAVLSRLARLYRKDRREQRHWLGREVLQEVLYGRIAVAVLENVLRALFVKVVRWEWRATEGGPRHWGVVVGTAREACAFLSAEIRRLARKKTEDGARRIDELRATRAALRGRQGRGSRCFALALGTLEAFDAGGKTMGEIDGLWVELAGKRMSVVVVEAKGGRNPKAKIRRQLEEMKERLGLWADCSAGFAYQQATGEHPSFGMLSVEFDGVPGERGVAPSPGTP